MKALNVMTVATGVLAVAPVLACAQAVTHPQPLPFEKLATECAPDVHPTTLKGVVSTESSWNPYAIGVVGGRLERQPRSLPEAVATARELERQGFNFSMGLGQVNRYNLGKYGESYETVFEPCRNLKAGSAILKACYQRARAQIPDDQQALRAAFSCYYSGNFTRGFRPDKAGQPSYVQKVVAKATGAAQPIPVVPAVKPESSVAVRPAGRTAGPAKQAVAPSEWVIFADGAQLGGQSVALTHAESAKETAVQVQLLTPGAAPAATAGRAEQVQTQREAQAVPVQRATANSAQQDAPFVQFVN
ncbi:lytic transglycosylase domain-containing protein [Xanthomonas oryzae]|uniref:lytic transglycosylase domain-containing protein n=2 Tax=Xanthomonas oryzae TaxID=347 RepID=UPI0006556FA1|nr:lytic transglycosylase domain-containing protein [Xanthomonas oryzae]AKJ75426.1 Type IV secretion system protein VirB1 [Xanthomonas oryzae pv. oryzicola]AKO22037.1 lytic transglycosylase [Xanthomonas oryzae pv. oryzicola]PNR90611.1 lytic transglycosylase [Xanthomonas oryzae pv. oryzae]PUE92091.1 lytic transglycosylase [Xanthomonas oryzae pv. oryzicola]RBG57535.1 lytic transglycosylase [Xanthomonas oryzae pv. oryzae]